MSSQLTWMALDEAGEARTAANRPAFLPQTLAFSAQTYFLPRNLPQKRYNSMELVPKRRFSFKSASVPLETEMPFTSALI